MRSKPSKITFTNEWAGPHGVVYYFDIEFEDGNKGQISSLKKDQDKFQVGVEVEYQQTKVSKKGTPQYDTIKAEYQPRSSGGSKPKEFNQLAISKQVAFQEAIRVLQNSNTPIVDMIKHTDIYNADNPMAANIKSGTLEIVTKIANIFCDWLMDKSSGFDGQMVSNALRRAVDLAMINELNITKTGDILSYADEVLFIYTKEKEDDKSPF